MPGYSDHENMWVKLCNIEKLEPQSHVKYPNEKSLVTLQVSDKIFKLKKNPWYKNESLLAKSLEGYKKSDEAAEFGVS